MVVDMTSDSSGSAVITYSVGERPAYPMRPEQEMVLRLRFPGRGPVFLDGRRLIA
jgi:hypothetical protein